MQEKMLIIEARPFRFSQLFVVKSFLLQQYVFLVQPFTKIYEGPMKGFFLEINYLFYYREKIVREFVIVKLTARWFLRPRKYKFFDS